MHRSDKFSWLKSTCTVCLPSGRSHLTSHVGKLARPHGILVHTGKSPLPPLFPERYLCLTLPSPQWNKCTLEALKCTWSQYGRSRGCFPVTFYAVFLIFFHQMDEVILLKLRTLHPSYWRGLISSFNCTRSVVKQFGVGLNELIQHLLFV